MSTRFLKGFLLAITLSMLVGCETNTRRVIAPNLKVVDVPPLQTEQSVEVGDTVVSKGKVYNYQGIDLKNLIVAGDGVFLTKLTIPPQRLMAKMEDAGWTYYVGENVTAYDLTVGTRPVVGGLMLKKTAAKTSGVGGGQTSRNYALFSDVTTMTKLPSVPPVYEFVEVSALDQPWLTREFIYNGRSGDTVKFLYRELSDSPLRGGLSQEAQYDLKESSIIGFKGLRIEILDATNTKLKYKVISSFPEAP